MKRYMVEIVKRADKDYVVIQSLWFHTDTEARSWFHKICYMETNSMVANIMVANFKENGEIDGDINFYEELDVAEPPTIDVVCDPIDISWAFEPRVAIRALDNTNASSPFAAVPSRIFDLVTVDDVCNALDMIDEDEGDDAQW